MCTISAIISQKELDKRERAYFRNLSRALIEIGIIGK